MEAEEIRKVEIGLLDAMDVSITGLSAAQYTWPAGNQTIYEGASGRGDNLLFYLKSGRRKYQFADGAPFVVSAGDVLFMPRMSRYVSRVLDESPSSGVCVMFSMLDEDRRALVVDAPPQRVARDASGWYGRAFDELLGAYMRGRGGKLRAKALLYQLLESALAERRADAVGAAFAALYPALALMEANLAASASVSALAERCFMSESTFRRRFFEYTGQTPAAYMRAMRVAKARELLESGLYTVEQAADALGFCDAAHLSRLFIRHEHELAGDVRRGAVSSSDSRTARGRA